MIETIDMSAISARCLQEKTGSCQGCPIMADLVLERTRAIPEQREFIAQRVAAQLCPEGNRMILPEESKRSIW